MWWLWLGIVVGAAAMCLIRITYLRREVAADIEPQLRRIQLQLDNLEAALNLAMVTRYADLARGLPRVPPANAAVPRRRAPEPPFAA